MTSGGPDPCVSYAISRPLAATVGTRRQASGVVGAGRHVARHVLRDALERRRLRPLDPQVLAAVVEQRHRVGLGVAERVDAGDEQLVVAGLEGVGDRALERRDRAVDERQAGRAMGPRGAAEVVAAGLDGRTREAVRQRLLVLGQDVDRVAAGGVDRRGDEPPPIEGDDDERRLEADRGQGVDGDPLRAGRRRTS